MSADAREWLIVGRVIKPHGIHGDLTGEVITDFPDRLVDGMTFGAGGETGPDTYHEVHRIRYHKGRWLLSVRGLRDRDGADDWRQRFLYLPELGRDELPEGFYYEHDLVGLQCRSPNGDELGEVAAIDHGPGQRRLVVRRGRREYLVPYVPQIVREIDLDSRVAVLDVPPGLLDDDAVTA